MPGNSEDPPFGVDKDGEELKIYYQMYQNRNAFNRPSITLTAREMQREIEIFFRESPDLLPPVFEPVLMSLKEFNHLPDLNGCKKLRKSRGKNGRR